MDIRKIVSKYQSDAKVALLTQALQNQSKLNLVGLQGSVLAFVLSAYYKNEQRNFVYIAQDKESAAYFFNDLQHLISPDLVFFFPASYKRALVAEETPKDAESIVLRTEVLNKLEHAERIIVVTYPEALYERVVAQRDLKQNSLKIHQGEKIDQDFVLELLQEYGFNRREFVFEAGDYAVRGSIIDVFSFANDFPFRIDFFDDEVESIRTFDTVSQLSLENKKEINIIPDFKPEQKLEQVSFFDYLQPEIPLFVDNLKYTLQRIDFFNERNIAYFSAEELNLRFSTSALLLHDIERHSLAEVGNSTYFKAENQLAFHTHPQAPFKKNFKFFIQKIQENREKGIANFVLSRNEKQLARIARIFEDLEEEKDYTEINSIVYKGFIDDDLQISLFADHEIFERYLRFELKKTNSQSGKEALTLRELGTLQPGDYVVHIDHGIGIFGGLEKMEVNGKWQDTVRLIYKDKDVLYVSLHALHKISRYKGKDGEPPKIYKLGTKAWLNLKNKTKNKVKDIAKDLIALYAKRWQEQGFSFTADSYLQEELEASFIYEDTPDQNKATQATKQDMESPVPMDRLVCGDVGFGKTEVAIRAAFKAATDSKQVVVLVPTTILAFQHFRTFSKRLKGFPVRVDYLSRNRTAKETKAILQDLSNGKIDIIIGTHRLVGKDIKFKDLGLLIIDEEQKFGVAVKEKLKALRVNVDTLTLTATPIPRTLQFSLMGARDLSIINTAPPNRYPIITEVSTFSREMISEAIKYEVQRNGQVYYVHNRVKDIYVVEKMLQKLVPGIRTAVAHGQMDGKKMEKILVDFINEEYDLLIATSIVENGLDIPNANTMIINNAHHFGLSDLHQLRGRVGRSNKKAFCYLIAPPLASLPHYSRRRLQALEQFSELGSGFNIAMQDLDIRGAGNMLGGEQSGFISDIGFETYQRILDEAVHELRETEFKNLFDAADDTKKQEIVEQHKDFQYVKDCQIDFDADLRFPESYIESITERFKLYKDLDSLKKVEEIDLFQEKLLDRFGRLPVQAADLIFTMRIRLQAVQLGVERIVFKKHILVLHFVSDPESAFYKTDIFGRFIAFAQEHPKKCKLKMSATKVFFSLTAVKSIHLIMDFLEEIHGGS